MKKALSILLSLLMAFSVFGGLSLPTAHAAGTGKALQLMPNGAAANLTGAQTSSVWFGRYKNTGSRRTGSEVRPLKWRVLSNANGKLFLITDQNIDMVPYNSENVDVTWENCTQRAWLNGEGADQFIGSAFGSLEAAAILPTQLQNAANPKNGTPGGNNTTDRVFSLSIAEATNTSYGFANNYNSSSTRLATNTEYTSNGGTFGNSSANGTGNSYWWLRSPGSDAGYKAYIDWDGAVVVDGLYIDYTMIAVRPAMNLDLSKVVFTSAAEGGKPGDGSFSPISDYNGTEWKLTLLDASRTFAVTETSATAVAGGSVTLHYSGAAVGANEYVSAIVTNAAGAAVYYGRLSQPEAAEGDLTLTVPALDAGSYTLKVFSEQYNGDFNTDFASAFDDVSLTVITQFAMDKINAKAELETYKNAADYRAAEQAELAAAIAAGAVLTEGTSYTVTYSSGCKAKGTYTVTVTAIGSYYTGTVEKTFTIK